MSRGIAEPGKKVEISIASDGELLKAVDAFVAEHDEFDRGKVIADALQLWYADERWKRSSPRPNRRKSERSARRGGIFKLPQPSASSALADRECDVRHRAVARSGWCIPPDNPMTRISHAPRRSFRRTCETG